MTKVKLRSAQGNLVLSQLKRDPPVVLCGSAISGFAPTSLPTGGGFTKGMFRLLFPHAILAGRGQLAKFLEEFFERVPFEHLLQRCPNQDMLREIIKEAFLIDRYNPTHGALAKGLVTGTISALITTNYDLCLDKVLGVNPKLSISKLYPDVLRVVTENDAKRANRTNVKIYFKIHGTSDDFKGETLVFSLTHESYLPEWKRQVLGSIIKARPLLIIGYSGKDFEICPELARMQIKQIIWNQRDHNHLTSNAQRLLRIKKGVFLEGDMLDLLEDLFGLYQRPSWAVASNALLHSISTKFPLQEIMEWRAALSNSMGFPTLALKSAEDLLSVRSGNRISLYFIRAKRQKAQALFHLGRYKQSAFLFEQASEHAKQLKDDNLRAELLLDVSSACIGYGSFRRALRRNKTAQAIARKLNDERKRKHLLGGVFLRHAHMLWYLHQLARVTRITPFRDWIIKKGLEALRKASSHYLDTGDWFGFQQIRLLGERMGIRPTELTDGTHYEPPPVRSGYEHLGYYVPQASYTRDQLAQRRGPLSSTEAKELREHLEVCRITGNIPEIWKILWLGIRRDPRWRKDLAKLREFYRSFRACEYSIQMRVFKLIFER